MPAGVPRWLVVAGGIAWRSLAVIALGWALVWFLVRIRLLVIPLLVAILAASLVVPASAWLEDHGWSRGLATAATIFGSLLALFGVVAFIGMQIAGQIAQFTQTIDDLQRQTIQWLTNGPLGLSEQQVQQYVQQAVDAIRSSIDTIMQGVLTVGAVLLTVVATFLLALVLTFFIVRDRETIVGWLAARTPPEYRAPIGRSAGRAWGVLSSYIRGVVIIAAADAIGTGIALFAVGVPLALTLTVMMFFAGFVPLVGAVVAGFFAVLVTLVTVGPIAALIIFVVIVVVQQVDANILQPVVMGHEVPLHPLVVLLVVTAGGLLWGIAGAALSVPIAAALSAAGNEIRVMREEASGSA